MKTPFDSRQLLAFASLAKTGSYTLAGKELFLTQSAISHSLKALERDAGCRLLDKVGKNIVLTQAGEHLLHHAQRILQEMSLAREELEHLGKWGRGRLRLGGSGTVCQYILPAVLREFKEKFPQSVILIEPGDTLQSIQLFEQARIDLALCIEPKPDKDFEFLPLFTDELMFLVAANHPWALEGKVTRADIPRQNYVLYTRNSYTFRLIETYFAREEMVLNSVIEMGNIEAIKELVKLGVGISVLPIWIAEKELAEGSLVSLPLGPRKLKRNWGILHRKDRRLSYPEESFIGICRVATEKLNLSGSLKSSIELKTAVPGNRAISSAVA